MATLCAGTAIPSWGDTWNWGQDTCQAGPDAACDIGLTAGPGLVVADGEGLGVAGQGWTVQGVGVSKSKRDEQEQVYGGQGIIGLGQGGEPGT